jgi:2',3'-cyclic-nucleotide 2'-phosphodiesterase (5'-nucleotidase family)
MNLKLIVLIITLFVSSCSSENLILTEIFIEKNIKIKDSVNNEELESLIIPYRNKIKSLAKVIGFSKESYSIRDSELESTLGNLIADVLFKKCDIEFKKINPIGLDFALFNFGGIRGTLNKGEVTQHDMFTIMPWKNTATIVKIKGEKVKELIDYINNENLAHPSSRINIVFDKKTISRIKINNKDFDIKKDYYVLTSNFLQEGGDKMVFFENPIELYSLNLNLRDLLIEYIKEKKIIEAKLDNRIVRK